MGKRILIIDDDPDICESMEIVLKYNKYDVEIAHDAEEGLQKLKVAKPDLIILDVMMNTPDEGFQLSYKLKQTPEYSQIPILMATAINEVSDLKFNPQGDEGYIQTEAFVEKPIKPDELIAKVKELLS